MYKPFLSLSQRVRWSLLPSLLLAGYSGTAVAQEVRLRQKMDSSVHRAEQREDWRARTTAQAIHRMAQPSRKLSLRALEPGEASPLYKKAGLVAVGVSRALPENVLEQGEWSGSPEGKRVWRLSIESAGAVAVRVRFVDFHVGTGNVWLLGTDENGAPISVGPYTGDGLFGDGEFWTDILPGDGVIIAYEPSADALGDQLPFRPMQISHRVRPATPQAARTSGKLDSERLAKAASCAVDVTCYPEYKSPASAVALMVFESDGGTYQCTGSLVSSAQPARPLFLTANHCISTAAEARSLITFFNYQTSACNGTAPVLSTLPRVTGASFLSGGEMSLGDFTLLQLTAFPAVDVEVLGWSAEEIASGASVSGISHPVGDYKRIAFGQRTRDVTIRFSDGDRMPANRGYQVNWLEGVTQSGSSGSPLLARIGDKQYVVGTLSAGPDVDEDNDTQVCRTRNLIGSYGRFSAAFPYLESILSSSVTAGTAETPTVRQGTLSINPSPIRVSRGQSRGTATLSWQTTGVSQVQIRVNSPTGPPMTGIEGPSGSATTGTWVSNGMIFYLQDASDGNSSGSGKTLATVSAQVIATTRADSDSEDD